MYRPVSLTTLVRELATEGYVGQRGHCKSKGLYFFSIEKEEKIVDWEQVFFVHHRIVSAVKRVQLVSDRMSCMVLRGCWFNIIVLNVQAPSNEKSHDSKDSSYDEFEQVSNHFPKYHMKIVLGEF